MENRVKPNNRVSRQKNNGNSRKTNPTQTTEGSKLLSKKLDLEDALQKIAEVCIVERDLVEIVMATCISIKLSYKAAPAPLWLMVVGVPSSVKTELVRFLRFLPFVESLDTMTKNPFASGYIPPKGGKTYDLLPLLDGKCFVVKDYTPLFSLDNETVKKILGELVSIYDGSFSKFSPTRGKVEYNSRFSHIGCITPTTFHRHQRYLNSLGSRFLYYQVRGLKDKEYQAGLEIAWRRDLDRRRALEETAVYCSSYCNQIAKTAQRKSFEEEPERVRKAISMLALLLSRARGIAETSNVTQAEEPWRILNQLITLGRTLALVRRKVVVTGDEVDTLKRVVFSSIPRDRRIAIQGTIEEEITAKSVSKKIGKSERTAERVLNSLERLKVLKVVGGKSPKYYAPEDMFRNVI